MLVKFMTFLKSVETCFLSMPTLTEEHQDLNFGGFTYLPFLFG